MYPLRFYRTIFKFELYRETVEIAGSSILEMCDQAVKEGETNTHQGRTEICGFHFIHFEKRTLHIYIVIQPRNAAVILIINID